LWRGRTVLVTGGSSGIGQAICQAAAAGGARVGMIARRVAPLEETADRIRRQGGVAETIACDAADTVAIAAAVAALEAVIGPADVAIACAGIHRESWPFDAGRAREVLAVNVGATVGFFAAVLPGMLDRGRGHLCGVASIAGAVGLPGNAAYCASKAAMIALLESLRVDCVPRGVRVTTACPGFVDTPMVTDDERARGGLMTADEAAARILCAIERGRAEAWFPWHTAIGVRLLRGLPAGLRDWIIRRTPPMKEA
jgi:short-subunit dehydrogenase